jgi:murein DD-endopeptidase MepM/ murein hydrolase activator NlpD
MKRVHFALLAMTAATLLAAQPAQPAQAAPAATEAVVPVAQGHAIKDEHLRPLHTGQRILRTPQQLAFQMPVIQVGRTATRAAVDLSRAFLTRPYMNYHFATSIFDHCNPDYTVDGRVCNSDGVVGLRSNGVDPSFSLGYAATPRGGNYIYYDGHNGWDMALNYENVMASAEGTVRIAGIDPVNTCFGQNVVIDHPNGFSTRYAHLSQIYVSPGQNVNRGQVVGQSGNTGCSSGAHLHFGVYVTNGWTAIDPFGWDGAGADPWPYDQGDLWLTGNPANPLPAAPSNVTAVAGNASAAVSWQPPSFDGGSPIANYAVTSNPGGTRVTVPGSQTSATVTGLSNGTSYAFTVIATNGLGAVGASAPSNSIVPTSVPGQPTGVTAAPANQAVRLAWTAPKLDGGSPITSYTVSPAGGGASTTVGNVTGTTITGLTGSAPLAFTVSAINANGSGLPSSASNSVTPYPVQQLFSLEAYGGVHPDAATPSQAVTGYWPGWKIARSSALLSDGRGGYVLDGFGGVHPFGQAGNVSVTGYWSNWDIARDLVLMPGTISGHGQGYVLEGFGGLHPFGGAPAARLSAYWTKWDIAVRAVMLSDGSGGYVMDAYGGLHPFAVGSNPMPPAITNYAYWAGWRIARDIALAPSSTASNVAGVTLDGWGGVHPFGRAGAVTDMAFWPNWDIARSVQFAPNSTAAHPAGWVLEGFGGIHPFGGAPAVPGAYWPKNDVAVKLMAR